MPVTATRAAHKRIAVILDFDDTLAPDSFRSLLEHYGIDKQTFEQMQIRPMVEAGWDTILAKMYCLIHESHHHPDRRITQQRLREIGHALPLFDGVPAMFDRLRASAREIESDVEVEYYLITSGFVEIVRGTRIANEFTGMWGCEFEYDSDGAITFAKRLITHPEKVRYVLQIVKGVSDEGTQGSPAHVYRNVPEEQLHVPLSQVIYVGDGASDMPAFELLHEGQGVAIAIYKGDTAEDWPGDEKMDNQRRVENLARADYRDGSELIRSLTLAVESISKRISLRLLSAGE
jgi:phosphoglycolate phosphatase-like HAD superfamily hydrolase